MKEVLKDKWLYLLSYSYLYLSVILFLLGFVNYIFSIPLVILLTLIFFKAVKNSPKMEENLFKNKYSIILIIDIIFLFVLMSGIGGYIWQNRYDHLYRNAVFQDLVNYDWPVCNDDVYLSYYIGFWLPSALIGKILGIESGYMFQVLWAFLGTVLSFFMICQYIKSVKMRFLLIFIFYSGLDVFLFLIFSNNSLLDNIGYLFNGEHIELSTGLFNSSSNLTLLFWLYNQIIPFWVGIMLILNQKNPKSMIFIFSLMMLYCPFPLVTLAFVIMFLTLKFFKENHLSIFQCVKYLISYENIVPFLLVIILALYYKSNLSANNISFISIDNDILTRFLLYFFFEFMIYIVFIRKDGILFVLIGTTVAFSFITLGYSYDFAWRTAIPLAFYIMLLVMKVFLNKSKDFMRKSSLIFIICLGAITPTTEMVRTVKNEYQEITNKTYFFRNDLLSTVLVRDELNENYSNFVGDKNSFFFQHIAKK